MRAVRFHHYGGIEVLGVEDIEPPSLRPHDVLVKMRAAGINPGEAKIRTGALHERLPATFPSGQGSDLAGTVVETGTDVTRWQVGDHVLGWSWERSSHAEYVAVPDDQLVAKPENLTWEVAGALYVAGCTAHAAVVAVAPGPAARARGRRTDRQEARLRRRTGGAAWPGQTAGAERRHGLPDLRGGRPDHAAGRTCGLTPRPRPRAARMPAGRRPRRPCRAFGMRGPPRSAIAPTTPARCRNPWR